MSRRHWVWDAFRQLTQERRMTEAEAIGQLTALWPSLPIFEIVRAEGDLSRTLGEVIDQGQQSQGAGTQQGNQGDQQGAGQGNPATDPNDFNAMLRQRTGREATTVELSRSALTGIKDQPDYNPADDPFRSRYRERYSQD